MSKTQFPIRIEPASKGILITYAESQNQKYTDVTANLVEKLAFALDKKEEPVFVELTDKLVLLSSAEYQSLLESMTKAKQFDELEAKAKQVLENANKTNPQFSDYIAKKLEEANLTPQPTDQPTEPEQKIGFVQQEEQKPEEPTAQEETPEPPKPHNIGRVGMI